MSYRVVGGFAVFTYVDQIDPLKARLTRDVDMVVNHVADLVRMKLTSFRIKDRVHIQDMDSVGLITPEIEASLPEILRNRLAEVRATE